MPRRPSTFPSDATYHRKHKTKLPSSIRVVKSAEDKIQINDEGCFYLRSDLVKSLFAIHEHYRATGERIVGIAGKQERGNHEYEVVLVGGTQGYAAKVRISDKQVYEFEREEL